MERNRYKLKIFLVLALCSSVILLSSCSWLSGLMPHNGGGTAPTATAVVNSSLPEMCMHVIDVGQGDSILIDFGTDEILIDGGDPGHGLCGYLVDYINGDLEDVVATHPHTDHIGGLISVLKTFTVDNVWTNGVSATTKTYSDFMDAVNSSHAITHVAKRGDTITVGNYTFSVLSPPATLFGDTNEDSIVLKLVYGKYTFQFEGDAGVEAEASMIGAGLISKVNVLKVGHHGSRTASSSDFVNATHPDIAVYTDGVGNTYGLPDEDVISRFLDSGAKVYGTDINGSVVICTDGNNISVETAK